MKSLKESKKISQIILFGRTNVGKSSLFNRLTENSKALISELAGTTRDANRGIVEWQGKKFELIDTGGVIDLDSLFRKKTVSRSIEEKVQKQVRRFLFSADIVLFVVDSKEGYTDEDRKIGLMLKKIFKGAKNILLVSNKADNEKDRFNIQEFFKLSLGEPIPVSAHSGSGTGDLLDIVISNFKKIRNSKFKKSNGLEKDEEKKIVNVVIIGQPNVGKSSLLNKMLGLEKVIVSTVPHTTRESQDFEIKYKDEIINIIDTAGLARSQHKKIKQNLRAVNKKVKNEKDLHALGMVDSLASMGKAKIVLFLLDINKPLIQEDLKIIEEVVKRGLSVIIVANKWDLVKDHDVKKYKEYIYGKLPFIKWAPILFVSAKTGLKVNNIFEAILEVKRSRQIEISNSVLNKFLLKLVKIHKPAKSKGLKHPRIYELSQTGDDPPEFRIRIGVRDTIHFSYISFIENRLREKFGFIGTPIKTWVKKGR